MSVSGESPPVYELDGSEQQHVSPFVFTLDELYYWLMNCNFLTVESVKNK